MRSSLIGGTLAISALAIFGGCASMDEGGASAPSGERAAETRTASSSGGPTERSSSSDTSRRDERGSASTSSSSPAASSSSSFAASRESRPGAEAGRAELIAQLNDLTKELATLRAQNARLRAAGGGAPAPTSSATAARPEPADEKLSTTLRSYSQFRQDLANIVAEMEKLRAENGTLSSQVRDLKSKGDQSAAVSKLEKDLQAERAARAEAERTAASLREQLRAVARAVNAAGVEGSNTRSGGR